MTVTVPLTGDVPDAELAPTFPVLDTLRAVGAIAVLTTHTAFWAGAYTQHGIWGALLSRFDVGVAIFFVLSGFLLTRPYIARAAVARPLPRTGRYYWKRFIRVYPVYAVTVVVTLLTVNQEPSFGVADWIETLLLLDIYSDDQVPRGLTQMWSLSVEVAFYLVLPLLMLVGVGRGPRLPTRRLLLLLGAAVALSIAWHLGLASAVDEHAVGMVPAWLPAYLTWFAVGILLALAHVHHARGTGGRTVTSLRSLGQLPGTCWAVVAGLMLVAATPVAGPSELVAGDTATSVAKHLLYAAVGGLVVLTGVFSRPDGRYARVMSTPALRHLGHISYSTFCIHLPVLHLVMTLTGYRLFAGHGVQIWALTLLVSLAASELLYRLVELPAMRLKSLGRRGGGSGRSSREPASPPSTPTHAKSAR